MNQKLFLSVLVTWLFLIDYEVVCFSTIAPTVLRKTSLNIEEKGLSMGLIDDLKLIFSEEGRKNKAEFEAREREEQIAAQKEIFERRRNPEKMKENERKVMERRIKLQEEKDVWKFQNKVEDGYDPINEWSKLREDGKIKVGDDLERDEGSRRLGSEGLVDVRIDERLPYIDQGYVEEGPDVMEGIKNILGGGKKKDDE